MICAIAFHALGMTPKFRSLQYGTEFMKKLEPRPGQLFVDITPPKDRWESWKDVNPVVLDHHETVKNVTEGLDGMYATNEAHSGAMLAFEQVFLPVHRSVLGGVFEPSAYARIEKFAHLAMVRDTWKKDHADWRDACCLAHALLFEGSKGLVDKCLHFGPPGFNDTLLHDIGLKIVESNDRRIEKVSRSAFIDTPSLSGEVINFSLFNSTEKLISDICNHLIDNGGGDISCGYFYLFEDGKTRVSVSLRSNGRVSVRKVAEKLGGGGHDKAAGFRMDDGDNTCPRDIRKVVYDTLSAVIRESISSSKH